jgi:subtilisin family serine protease
VSTGPAGTWSLLAGTSLAAPFVTGSIALLMSLWPAVGAATIRYRLTHGAGHARRTAVVPPLLDAWAAHERILSAAALTFDSTPGSPTLRGSQTR